MYCWDGLWSLPQSLTRIVVQGLEAPASTREWVPCGVFHHGGSPAWCAERVRRLAVYWWHAIRLVRRRDLPVEGWLRAPWLSPRQSMSVDRAMLAPGPMEDAWIELDAQVRNAELNWV